MIEDFKKQTNETIWEFLHQLTRMTDVSIMDVKNFSPTTSGMPVYIYTTSKETVILCVDWDSASREELADEEGFDGLTHSYYCNDGKSRKSPVWRLMEFTRQYKQALVEGKIKTPQIWSILLTNSNIINYQEMRPVWELMNITVLHNFKEASQPQIWQSVNFNEMSLVHHGAFRDWCIRQGYLHDATPKDSYEDDPEYNKMEFDIDDEDYDLGDFDCEEIDNIPQINLSDFPAGSVKLSQGNMVKVEVLQPIGDPRKELEKLVGCDNIKAQINDLLNLTQYNRWMHFCYPDWKQHEVSLHAIFFGRPGTGKTTVCKIYGGLLKESGVLSKGHVVVCNRSSFLGGNWGDEEKAIRQILNMAKGGVLMIDEAYLLNSNNPNDPGKLIIPQMMDTLSDEQQRDIAIVLCGYKEPMQRLLDLNPGLASRFPNRYEFQDFTIEDLIEITFRRLKEHNYHFTRTALKKYKSLLSAAYNVRDPQTWGNARFVANQLEHIYLLHAKRCMKHFPKEGGFFSITPADIQPFDIPKAKPHIGF